MNPCKAVLPVALAHTMLVMLFGCTNVPDSVENLPELPTEFAQQLQPAQTAPVLLSKSSAAAAPTEQDSPVALGPTRACTAKYDGYVIYPITVCYPPFDDLDTAVTPNAEATFVGTRTVPATRFFKLSAHPSKKFRHPLFCSVRSGPWYAHVEGAQKCKLNPNIRVFTAQILGAPEPVVVEWLGGLNNVPPPLVLTAISESGEECSCCSGVKCPNGDCKPTFNMCGVMPPAIQ
jgi:hypothetical protein